jgi:hypothetical protein
MMQNYLSITSNLFLTVNMIFVNDVASLCQDKIKTVRVNLVDVFLALFTMTDGQKAIANNTANQLFTYNYSFVNQILMSSVAEGRGGGGGHGNADWVLRHQLGAFQNGYQSEILIKK